MVYSENVYTSVVHYNQSYQWLTATSQQGSVCFFKGSSVLNSLCIVYNMAIQFYAKIMVEVWASKEVDSIRAPSFEIDHSM